MNCLIKVTIYVFTLKRIHNGCVFLFGTVQCVLSDHFFIEPFKLLLFAAMPSAS